MQRGEVLKPSFSCPDKMDKHTNLIAAGCLYLASKKHLSEMDDLMDLDCDGRHLAGPLHVTSNASGLLEM